MKVNNDYFESPAHHFCQKNPNFWKLLRKYQYDDAEFLYICNIVTNNVVNLSITAFETISPNRTDD